MNPIGVEPATIRLRVAIDSDEPKLGTNPFALAHLESSIAVCEMLAIETVGEADNGLAAMSNTSLGIADTETQVYVLVDARLIVSFVLGRGFQCGNELLILRFVLVGITTGKQQQLELFP